MQSFEYLDKSLEQAYQSNTKYFDINEEELKGVYCDRCNKLLGEDGSIVPHCEMLILQTGTSKEFTMVSNKAYRPIRLCSKKCQSKFTLDKFKYHLPSKLVALKKGSVQVVKPEMGKLIAAKYGMEYVEVNLNTGDYITELFVTFAKYLYSERQKAFEMLEEMAKDPKDKDKCLIS
jgi:hypothetical protein